MEALGVNVTKSLFSSNLTKETKIENPNGQEDSDLNLNLEEDTWIIMQQCLQPHLTHSGLEPSGTKNIFKLKNLARNKWAHPCYRQ